MAKYGVGDIRTIALLGHGGTGKTTLAEHILQAAGATSRLGSVDDGTSILDADDEEKARKHTIDAAICHFSWKDKEINLIDTPGYSDFIGAVICAVSAVEGAIITVSASEGIQVNSRRVWSIAEEAGIARAILITRMDGENIDFDGLLSSINEVFGTRCIPMQLPVGAGPSFKGIVDVMNPPSDIPAEVLGDVEATRSSLMEAVVEADDELLEKYLGEEEISSEELAAAFTKALASQTVTPVLCCAAAKEIGLTELMDFMALYMPSPVEGVKRKCVPAEGEGEAKEIEPDPAGPFVARVFKCVTDPFVGKMAYARVFSGTMTAGQIHNARTGRTGKAAQIFRPQGKEQVQISEGIPGDIVGITKVEDIMLSDTLCTKANAVKMDPISFPEPMVSVAVAPKSRGDEQKISGALAKLADEDATFRVSRDSQTNELLVTGMTQLHLDVMLSRLKNRFDVEVTTSEPKIPYRETISAKAEGKYRHKKQTGGRGQFAEVWLRIEPRGRGEGFEFVNSIFGGAIPSQFMPAVEKGIREAMAQGIIAGYPVQDVRVEVYDGKDHPVDSSEAAFKIAGARAFKEAFLKAKPVLLEPIVNMEISIPSQYMGDISGDLNSRRGRIQNVNVSGDMQVIQAVVPMAEVTTYGNQLRSITGGTGSYTMEFSHYDTVPTKVAESIIARSKPQTEEE